MIGQRLVIPNLLFSNPKRKKNSKLVDLWVDDNASALTTYGEINTWDVSLITDMSNLFNGKSEFNEDLSNWDVSSVMNMEYIFKVQQI